MQEPDHRADPKFSQSGQPAIGPSPVDLVEADRGKTLPDHRKANGSDAESREAVKVLVAPFVARPLDLVEPLLPYPVNRALDTAPPFDGSGRIQPVHAGATISRRRTPDSLEYSVSACAT